MLSNSSRSQSWSATSSSCSFRRSMSGLRRKTIVKTKPVELKDSDLDRRTPDSSSLYEKWKYLENLALSLSSKDKCRPHVVCAGILYGNGETTFNDLFREAWLMRATHSIIIP